jgi:hypothetical protein
MCPFISAEFEGLVNHVQKRCQSTRYRASGARLSDWPPYKMRVWKYPAADLVFTLLRLVLRTQSRSVRQPMTGSGPNATPWPSICSALTDVSGWQQKVIHIFSALVVKNLCLKINNSTLKATSNSFLMMT